MYTLIAPVPKTLAKTIRPYRHQYDPLAELMPPHISVLNPFEYTAELNHLNTHLNAIGDNYAPIKVSIVGWDIYHHIDYQIRLPIMAGRDEFIKLREDLLTDPLEYCAGQDKDYWPHITLGRFSEHDTLEIAKQDLRGFEPQFIFRIAHLELLRWEQPAAAWQTQLRFGLNATLTRLGQQKT